ncbi:MAG: hypothetical protein CVT73_04060 [Alphaproteobacteria bacterium HGW-Alphaproteobacteria-12]|nr:MAG: hypothetical protein CVT73_04060 [Alphaproteobacteria bacterium HGW-Alphaproteobacteria-12]
MFQRSGRHSGRAFTVRMILLAACSAMTAGCNSMGAPWSGSVDGTVSLPANIDEAFCGAGQSSCNEFESLLVSVRTTKETYKKNYERSADAVGLFDLPLAVTAVTAAGAAIFGAPSDMLKGLGLGAGALVLGRSYVNPKDTALAYLLAEKRLSCVGIRSRGFRDVPGSEGELNIADLKLYSIRLSSKRGDAEDAVAEYEKWVAGIDDLTDIDAGIFKRAAQTATALRALIVQAKAQEALIEKDLTAFKDRVFIVQGASDAIRQSLAVSLLEDRAASFDATMATLKNVIPQITGFQLPAGAVESADGDAAEQVISKNIELKLIADDLKTMHDELASTLQDAAEAVQNFPALVVKINECATMPL